MYKNNTCDSTLRYQKCNHLTFYQDWMEVDTSCGNVQCHSTNSKSKSHQSVTCNHLLTTLQSSVLFFGRTGKGKIRMPDRRLINHLLFFCLFSCTNIVLLVLTLYPSNSLEYVSHFLFASHLVQTLLLTFFFCKCSKRCLV